MAGLVVEYAVLLSTIFLGISGGFIALLVVTEGITLKGVVLHFFTGIMAALYIGPFICSYYSWSRCEVVQLFSASTAVYLFRFIILGAQDILLNRAEITKALIDKLVQYLKRDKK